MSVAVIYGQNGVGKSTWLKHVLETTNKPAVYYGKLSTAVTQNGYAINDWVKTKMYKTHPVAECLPYEAWSEGLRQYWNVLNVLALSNTGWIVLLDLPETGLSVDAQRSLGELIAKLAVDRYIFIVTHAPEITAPFGAEAMYLMNWLAGEFGVISHEDEIIPDLYEYIVER